jgi:putative YpdA family bacillithiol system oxidoreductase
MSDGTTLPGLLCVASIAVFFVLPMYVYILLSERRAKRERAKAIEAGRHEPVTIQPYIDPAVCMGSGACVPACPEHVLSVIEGQAVAVNMSACIGHGACVAACPVGAIELVFGSEKRGIDIPRVGPDFQTNVPGVYIAGELGGMGLIANATEQGARALASAAEGIRKDKSMLDVAIVGAGPAGIAAAAAAKARGLSYVLLEQEEIGGAVRHYPRKKLVFTRPMEIPGYPKVNLRTLHKEALVELFVDVVNQLGIEVSSQERVDQVKPRSGGFSVKTTRRELQAQRVILALGRRGTPRKLGATGEDVEKVAYSLLEPEHYSYDHLLVVGGGDSAVEAAIQLSEQPGNKVTLSYRGDKINRPKEKNIERLREAQKEGRVEVLLESQVTEIRKDRVVMDHKGESVVLANDYVFVMVGGVLPTKFLQDVGIQIEKHFGKRVEVADEPAESKAVPSPKPRDKKAEAPSLPPQLLRGSDEPTIGLPPFRIAEALGELEVEPVGNDEPTIELAAAPPPTDPPLPELELGAPPQRPAQSPLPREIVGLVQAAESRLANGGYDEVLAITSRITERIGSLSRKLAEDAAGTVLRWVYVLEGEAHLGLGEWAEAVEPFGAATDCADARVGPPELLQRAQLGLGRALSRTGELARAAEPLGLLLQTLSNDDPVLPEVLRLAAEGLLEAGDLDLAEVRWGEAADGARARQSAEDLALALRGVATCSALRGQLRPALRQLSDGLGLLTADSDPLVVAALLADAVQLESALGRYPQAITHAQKLLEWTADHPPLRARALTLLAAAQCAIGSYAGAVTNVTAAAELVGVLGSEATDAKLRTARLLCELGRNPAAREVLDGMAAPPASAIHDYAGQQLALRARASARQDPEVARSLATTALGRPAAGHPLSAMALRLDAARAMYEAGNGIAARTAVKRGLKVVPGSDPKGARLELLVLLHETGPDDAQVSEALARTAARVMAGLPRDLAASFRTRANIAPALASTGAVPADPVTRPLAIPPLNR